VRIVNIIGTRPQYIKLAAMHLELNDTEHEILNIDTGQHYDTNMSDNFITGFKLTIHYKTMNILEIKEILDDFNPDVVLLYGDTYSTLIGLIASKGYLTAHIEAGARTFNIEFREELIRMAVDHACDICFTPSVRSSKNLLNEGKEPYKIYFVGDVMYDLLLSIDNTQQENHDEYVYMTLHRPGNVDNIDRLKKIFEELSKIDKKIIFPVHPRTLKNIEKFNIKKPENVVIIEPCSYIQSIKYIKNAKFVITDSGGVEKECYLLKTPGITLNKVISWHEAEIYGWNKQVDICDLYEYTKTISKGLDWHECYGDGTAAKQIVKILERIVK